MRVFGFVLLTLLLPATVLSAEVQDVRSRGEVVRLLVETVRNPRVVVVLFAGGAGVLNISPGGRIGKLKGNFLVRTGRLFQDHGAITAVIDAPTDQGFDLYRFRASDDHARDVGAVLRHLRAKYALPVWLIGTSRGTNSVANAAVRLTADKPDGIVLTATMLRFNDKGDNVLDMDLDEIRMPVLIAHHQKDECRVTPPGKVPELKRELERARPVKVLMFEGGGNLKGNVCGAFHYHGFRGIEEKVVAAIMNWVKAPTP